MYSCVNDDLCCVRNVFLRAFLIFHMLYNLISLILIMSGTQTVVASAAITTGAEGKTKKSAKSSKKAPADIDNLAKRSINASGVRELGKKYNLRRMRRDVPSAFRVIAREFLSAHVIAQSEITGNSNRRFVKEEDAILAADSINKTLMVVPQF